MVTKERVAELAHELPEVEDGVSWGSPVFRVRGKPFAGLSSREPNAIWARCDGEERPLLVASNPEGYRLTPHYERSPAYLLVHLDHVTEAEVRERLLDAWLIQAPKRLAARYASE